MYSIKIHNNKTNTFRYVLWCDECWYETCSFENKMFTYEQAKLIVQQLDKHYRYHVSITDGKHEEFYDYGNLVPKKKIIINKKEPKATTVNTQQNDIGFINLGF